MSFDHKAAVSRVAATAAEYSVQVDAEGSFPTHTIEAARETGLLGLMSSTAIGGKGLGIREAAEVIECVAQECGSSAMVLTMHYCGTAVIERYGSRSIREDIARGEHLSTLAFSESGSRSHFWAPVSTATNSNNMVTLNAQKSWITSSNHADAYVWTSTPVSKSGASTLWLVPRTATGLNIKGGFDGLGLRGNNSCPVTAENVQLDASVRLGGDGEGFGIIMETVLPVFNILIASGSLGLTEAGVNGTIKHVTSTRYEHLDSKLADLPTIRAYVSKMQISTDQARALWLDTIAAVESRREDAMLRVLEVKCALGDTAAEVLNTAMRVCGGSAFRKDVGVERRFRDVQAALVMAPTSDQLYDFIGKAVCGMELF